MGLGNIVQTEQKVLPHHLKVHEGGKPKVLDSHKPEHPNVYHLEPLSLSGPVDESLAVRGLFILEQLSKIYDARDKYVPSVIIDQQTTVDCLHQHYSKVKSFRPGSKTYRLNYVILKDDSTPAMYIELQEHLGGGVWDMEYPYLENFVKISK